MILYNTKNNNFNLINNYHKNKTNANNFIKNNLLPFSNY